MGEPSNPHPRSGPGRSECDPISIRPRPLHLKTEQRNQIVPYDDRDVSFAGFILGQLLGLISIRILSCGRDQTLLSKENLTSSKRNRAPGSNSRTAATAAARSTGYRRDR